MKMLLQGIVFFSITHGVHICDPDTRDKMRIILERSLYLYVYC